MLTYPEALLFARAGDDVRREAWPQFSFVRWVVGTPRDIEGMDKIPFEATTDDVSTQDWRRA